MLVDAGTEYAEYATFSCPGSLYKTGDFSRIRRSETVYPTSVKHSAWDP